MRILWWVNSPVGHVASLLGYRDIQSGKWIEACFQAIKKEAQDVQIDFVVMGNKKQLVHDKENSSIIIELPIARQRGKRTSTRHEKEMWEQVVELTKPDAIVVWGTEYSNPLDLMDCAHKIPVVVFIQGLISAIAKYPFGNMRFLQLLSVRDIKKLKAIIRMLIEQQKLLAHVKYEQQIIERSQALISDNHWALSCCDPLGNFKHYDVPLPISKDFFQHSWNKTMLNQHIIFSIAGSSPAKGLHELLYAAKILLPKYPDLTVLIPGAMAKGSIYFRYLERYISTNGLTDHVKFLGKLSSNEMAEQISKSSLFVMPSCIENHSSTLREAMIVGCPCITSSVGGVCELVHDGENGLIYRYGEPKVLAGAIDRLFSNANLAEKIGVNGKKRVIDLYPQDIIGKRMLNVYNDIIYGGKEVDVPNQQK